MKNKLFVFIFVLLIILLAGFFWSKNTAKEKMRILKLAHGLNTQHPVHKTMVYMAEKVKQKSDGKLIIQIFPSEQLGDEKECLEALQLGYLAMTKTSTAPMESFVPKIKIFGIPYLFRDSDHFWKVALGPIGKELLAAGESFGLKGLCYYDAGARSFYAKKPIHSPKDLKGLKVRVQKSVMSMEMIEAMGGSPTPISWGELYTALDQGVVDAAENNPPSFDTSRHFEICKFYILNEHTRLPDMLIIRTSIWNNLTTEQQKVLEEAVDESVEYNRAVWQQSEEDALRKFEAAGVKIIRPNKDLFLAAVMPMWEKYKGTEIGELIEKIQKIK